jgi:hypothetical protein
VSGKRPASVVFALATASVCAAACSTILGLEPPPQPGDGGTTADAPGPPDGAVVPDTTPDTVAADSHPVSPGEAAPPDATLDSGANADANADTAFPPEAAADAPVVCQPLSAGDGATTYNALEQVTPADGGVPTWSFFDSTSISGPTFGGGTFDGTYVYFAGRGTSLTRYDPSGSFTDPGSWIVYAPRQLSGFSVGFVGAVYDGSRYVYFIPSTGGTPSTPSSIVARYDTQAAGFNQPSSWGTFDTSVLSAEGGALTSGFFGAGFDGRYLYLVPRNDGVPDGRVVRFDALLVDAGALDAGADAHDAAPEVGVVSEAGPAFDSGWPFEPTLWTTFDLTALDPTAAGFAGAVFDGRSVYLVPNVNDAFDAQVNGGTSGTVARLRADLDGGGFADAASWSTFDLTHVNGLATNFMGGAFDGRYLYLAPRGSGIALRFDTTASQLGNPEAGAPAWDTYDVTRVTPADGSVPEYAGTAYDGRFVYYVPTRSGTTLVARYDTWSTFSADCAWSTIDLNQLGDAGPIGAAGPFVGAVFDGQYVYLVPSGSHTFARFYAKAPSELPSLPAHHGSFL